MVRTPDIELMSVAVAKSRLLELGQRKSKPSGLLGNRAVRVGVLLIGAALLGRLFGRKSPKTTKTPLLGVLAQSAVAASPLLIAQLLKFLNAQKVPASLGQ